MVDRVHNIAEDCPTTFEIEEQEWNRGWNHTLRSFKDGLGQDFAAYVTEFLDYLYQHDPQPIILNTYQEGVCDAIDLLIWIGDPTALRSEHATPKRFNPNTSHDPFTVLQIPCGDCGCKEEILQ